MIVLILSLFFATSVSAGPRYLYVYNASGEANQSGYLLP